MFGFILGAVAGSVAAYLGHERIRQYMEHDVSALRDRAADRLGDLGERAACALAGRATGTTNASGGAGVPSPGS